MGLKFNAQTMLFRIRRIIPLAFVALTLVARAHDASQSSTNIWLRPDQIEVELIMSRVPSRALVDNAPPVPVTDANFESTYYELFQKSAPTLVEISMDGHKIEPSSIKVELYEETDLRFDFLFLRPPDGKFSFTAHFIKRMEDGYINTLGVNEGLHMIGMDNQTADRPTWDMDLGASSRKTKTTTIQPASATATSDKEDTVITDYAVAEVRGHNLFFKGVLLCVIIILLSLGVALWRKGDGPPPPSK